MLGCAFPDGLDGARSQGTKIIARAPLRLGAGDEELAELIRGIWGKRTDRYSELRTAETSALPKVEMSYIGG